MRRLFILILASLILASCATQQFQIKPLGDKFSDPKAPYGASGVYNRLSTKAAGGGLHIDDKGLYINPYVYKDRKTNEVVEAGFFISHYTFDLNNGYRPIGELIFLCESGDRVAVKGTNHDSELNIGTWNSISKQYIGSYTETAISTVSLTDFKKICTAKKLELKVVGGKLTQTYSAEEISESFVRNLNLFYQTQFK